MDTADALNYIDIRLFLDNYGGWRRAEAIGEIPKPHDRETRGNGGTTWDGIDAFFT